MLEPLEWDEQEAQTQETVLPAPLRAPRRSRPNAAGLRMILGSSPGDVEQAPATERDVAPATVSSPPTPTAELLQPEPPVIDVIEADEVTTVADSDAPPSAIRSVALPPLSAPLPLIAAEARAPGQPSSTQSSVPPATLASSYPPAPSLPAVQPRLGNSLEGTLLAHEVVRLRRGMLVALVVASAALTLSLIMAAVLLWQLAGPTQPAPPQHTPASYAGPQLL